MQELRGKSQKADAAFSQERAVLVKKVIELQVKGGWGGGELKLVLTA